tara:strand:- start:495 stop:707 length:213 start_codon:yes stop_codon:yes gene_type:complete
MTTKDILVRGLRPEVQEAFRRQAAARGVTQAYLMASLIQLLGAAQDYARGEDDRSMGDILTDLGLESQGI